MSVLVRFLIQPEEFVYRHIGPSDKEISEMLSELGFSNLDDFIEHAVPPLIFAEEMPDLPDPLSETEVLDRLKKLLNLNRIKKSYIGKGYQSAILPEFIKRNVLEQPGWYTSYTPYQPEISQGRLELLFYFQTMICELTKLDIANASLLDEATAAAEAAAMTLRIQEQKGDARKIFFVDQHCHPQTIAVIRTRLAAQQIGIKVAPRKEIVSSPECFGAIVQYPSTEGEVFDLGTFVKQAKVLNMLTVAAVDPMALVLLRAPGHCGVDIAVGSSQRFGLPLGFGGPHAGFLACLDMYKRHMPGRLVGLSIDKHGAAAYRLTLQTREQHIRREKASSNICTAQALLAIISTVYAIHHSPKGLKNIASRIHSLTVRLIKGLSSVSIHPTNQQFFDTVTFERSDARVIVSRLGQAGYNVYHNTHKGGKTITIAFDETTTEKDVLTILQCFSTTHNFNDAMTGELPSSLDRTLLRTDNWMTQEVFHRYSNETELMRYLKKLRDRDLALDRCMIPLGSCTMKLNSAASMAPISWEGFGAIHPFVPAEQAAGFHQLMDELQKDLCAITGLAAVSFQPNSGAQGEYAGLLAIRSYFESIGQPDRNICLIPISAHGTNPASATLAGMKVVPILVTAEGSIDVSDLEKKLQENAQTVACIMVTYPSTYGIYNENMPLISELMHRYGAQVYMDGANMNALVGVANPGSLGVDVMHLNLHKTFAIPHGGGGPGVGPIAVAAHLVPFLPAHPFDGNGAFDEGARGEMTNDIASKDAVAKNTVAGAPYGSALILLISYSYIKMMGLSGLYKATLVAVLNANYIAKRLAEHYKVLYRGAYGLVAHECIFDPRPFKDSVGVSAEDIAKRLIDYGFHAPTMSFPVPDTLMVEPTESESKYELDRFCNAMIAIREEIRDIESGKSTQGNNLLANAPHTLQDVLNWQYPYSLREAILPEAYQGDKYWTPVGRVDNVYGDRNLQCVCPPMENYQTENAQMESDQIERDQMEGGSNRKISG